MDLARLMYELNKQKFIMKTIDDWDIDMQVQPLIAEITKLKLLEGEILASINESVQELRLIAYHNDQDDY